VLAALISVSAAAFVPLSGRLHHSRRGITGMSRQKIIASAMYDYESEHDGMYPESVATVGSGKSWSWAEPETLTAAANREPNMARSISEYLRPYIEDSQIMFCLMPPGV